MTIARQRRGRGFRAESAAAERAGPAAQWVRWAGSAAGVEQHREVVLETGVADRRRLHPAHLDALARGEPGNGAEHGDAVIAMGVDGAATQAAAALDHHAVGRRLDLPAERAQSAA